MNLCFVSFADNSSKKHVLAIFHYFLIGESRLSAVIVLHLGVGDDTAQAKELGGGKIGPTQNCFTW